NLDWRQALPIAVSKKAKESWQQWKDFYQQLPAHFEQQGVAGGVQAMCRQYLPVQQLTEEQLLKKDTILTLAKEAQADMHRFLEDTTLSVHGAAAGQPAYGIRLLTFHAAKGLEFPLVFIAGAENGITPSGRSDPDPEEARSRLDVALTRAKEALHITAAAKRVLYGKEQAQELSPFVEDIPGALREWVKIAGRQPAKSQEDEGQLLLF